MDPVVWRRCRQQSPRVLRDAEVPEQAAREVRLDDAAACVHLADRLDHLVARRALEQVPGRARLHGIEHLLFLVEDGEDQHLDFRPPALHLARHVDAAHARQPEVLQQHVGLLSGQRRQRRFTGKRGADDLDPGRLLENLELVLEHRWLIFHHHHLDRGRGSVHRSCSSAAWTVNSTRVPCPGDDVMPSFPRTFAARSRMFTKP